MKRGQGGFTLIEVAIAVVLIGILMVPMMQAYSIYIENKRKADTTGNLDVVSSALQKFAIKNGRYPRPAQRNLKMGDAGFGVEVTDAVAWGTNPNPYHDSHENCVANTPLVCSVRGQRDTPVDPADSNSTNEHVFFGDVPFATLGLPMRYIVDGYGGKLTYAVSRNLTNVATFGENHGVINVEKRAAVNALKGAPGSAHFVVVSHGADNRGAFSINGVLIAPCSGNARDRENCNFTNDFTNNYDVINGVENRYYSGVPGTNDYYDDYINFSESTASDLWSRTATTDDIFNRTSGRIRIGPGGAGTGVNLKVEVRGNVRAIDSAQANRLCPYAGGCAAPGTAPASGTLEQRTPPRVFVPKIIAGKSGPSSEGGVTTAYENANPGQEGGGILCDRYGGGSTINFKALTGISNVDEECDFNTLPLPSTLGAACPDGRWAKGTDAAGKIRCELP